MTSVTPQMIEEDHMDAAELRTAFDWSNTMPDMVDRVIRAIESQQRSIAACTGWLRRARSITWTDNGYTAPLDAGNFRFDAGGWADDDESILAERIGGAA